MITTTATDIQNNFGKYLKAVQEGNEIIILKKGKEVARLISKDTGISFLTDSLTGILKKDYNEKDIRAERIAEKYENIYYFPWLARDGLRPPSLPVLIHFLIYSIKNLAI